MIALSLPIRRALALTLLGLVLLAGWSLLAGPLLQRHRDYAESAEQAARQLDRYKQLAALMPQLEAQRAQLIAGGAQGRLPGASDSLAGAALQEQVKQMVEAKGAKLRSIQLLPAASEGAFRRIPLRLQMTLSTPQLQAVLHAVESGRPYLFVHSLDVGKRPVAQRAGTVLADDELEVSLDLHGYRSEAP